ncbi:MAG: glycosyltransferase family 2 protein [Phycisphaerae bacterium]
MNDLLLSIIIPVYNEESTLFDIIERVVAVDIGIKREFILVDDGSTDGTRSLYPQCRTKWPDETFNVKLQSVNKGKGAAIRAGLALAGGDIIIIQDADLEYDPADYPRLLQPILDNKADVVYGSRFLCSNAHRVLGFWHTLGNRVLTGFSNMFTDLNLTDMETCYKVFTKEVAESLDLVSNRFTVEPEITAKVANGGWRLYEVGISYAGRSYGQGKKITWVDGLAALWAVFRFRFFS